MPTIFRRPFTPAINTTPESIAVLESVVLGGLLQWITIRSHDRRNPLLLFLPGGPGAAELGSLRKALPRLEQYFTVVSWAPRGSAKTDPDRIDPASFTVERILEDAHELIALLLQRFGQQRLFLAGHSVGTIPGMLLAQRYPHLLHAYVGCNQVIDRAAEEWRTHDFVLRAARASGNQKALKAVEPLGYPVRGVYRTVDDTVTQRRWATEFGGVSHDPGKALKWHIANYLVPEYSIAEFTKIFKGLNISMKHLWSQYGSLNFREQVPAVGAPIYLVMGRHDKITYYDLAEEFLSMVEAPHKELLILENAAHIGFFEEPERFQDLLINKVLPAHR